MCLNFKTWALSLVIFTSSCFSVGEVVSLREYLVNWQPRSLDGESFDFISELRNDLKNGKFNYWFSRPVSSEEEFEKFAILAADNGQIYLISKDVNKYIIDDSIYDKFIHSFSGDISSVKSVDLVIVGQKTIGRDDGIVMAVAVRDGPFMKIIK